MNGEDHESIELRLLAALCDQATRPDTELLGVLELGDAIGCADEDRLREADRALRAAGLARQVGCGLADTGRLLRITPAGEARLRAAGSA